ncbi:MAG TPA: TauD/TfdA family dioxygenase [Pyrinomonadaceae bacterium]|nr:TauD/TfdA family dioxygenase [Pyrinomonadaceae bacterium]
MTEPAIRKRSMKPPSARPRVAVAPRELVHAGHLPGFSELPRVITPGVPDVDLVEWTANNLSLIENDLLRHGAILFRGFKVDSPAEFERFALAICPELFNENGEHPRKTVSGQVYTPVFYPPDKQLLWHNENSFNHRWPTRIWFCCLSPAITGGETPLVDSRKVYQLIDPVIRNKFAEKQVMYVRNYGNRMGLDWQTVFQTSDKDEVARRCAAGLMDHHWHDENRLRTSCVRPAVVRHPVSGEMVWFNQAQHWHVSCLDPESRQVLTSSFREEELPRNCYYGDGSPIEDAVMKEILDVYASLEVSFPWAAGDIVILDNLLTAHGRNPFSGERKMLVAMGAMMSYADVEAEAK